jgi:hypothetical protein
MGPAAPRGIAPNTRRIATTLGRCWEALQWYDDGRRDHAAIRRPCATYFPQLDQAKRARIVKYNTLMVRHHCTQAKVRELLNDGIDIGQSKHQGTRQREHPKGWPTPNPRSIFAGSNAGHFSETRVDRDMFPNGYAM